MKNKLLTISIIFAVVLVGGIYFLTVRNSGVDNAASKNNVTIVDGKQIIEIHAKGGYQPRKSIAKAGKPTILRVNTNGTFDCSSFVRIPSMNIGKTLPSSGVTDIDLGSPESGLLNGTCAMGMYPFEIDFEN